MKEDKHVPPKAVQQAAKKGLDWYKEGHGGDGLVPKTIREARDMANGSAISVEKIMRMRAWFARHSVDKQSESWHKGTDSKPSPSQVAWALWGGDAGRVWAVSVMRKVEKSQKNKDE